MKKVEMIVGNIFAVILTGMFVLSILYTIFCLFFRDGRGVSMYGGRGEFYMSE